MKYLNRCGLWLLFAVATILVSCKNAQNIAYMQNMPSNVSVAVQEAKEIKLQPGDRLNIMVHSRDEELVNIFNVSSNGTNNSNNIGAYYTVDNSGNIDFPTLGLIPVEGKTRLELANEIKYRLLSGSLLRDPVVTVEYSDMGFSALGELKNTGRIDIKRDKITILEAIAEAGDLTLDGKRENVTVIRTENGVQTPYRIDLTNVQSIYSSPAYYIQQNDIIYVEPSQKRANESTAMGNLFSTPSFWMSLASFGISIINFLVK
jgi:polysaccharide biosynthesis/export protein